MRKKKKETQQNCLLERSKLTTIMSKVLKYTKINRGEFVFIHNEAEKISKLKKAIRMVESAKLDTERNKLIEDYKKMRINK